jgi:hypothetical protein
VQTENRSAFVQTNAARRFESSLASAMLRLGPRSFGGSGQERCITRRSSRRRGTVACFLTHRARRGSALR